MLYNSFKRGLEIIHERKEENHLIAYFNEYYECDAIIHQFERPLFLAFLDLKGYLEITEFGLWPVDESILGVEMSDYFDLIESDGGVNLMELDSIYSLEGIKELIRNCYEECFDLRKKPNKNAVKKWQEYSTKNDSKDYFDLLEEYDFTVKIYESKGKYGLKNWDGTILATASYDDFMLLSIHFAEEGDRVVAAINDQYGVIELGKSEKWLLNPEYDYIGVPNNFVNVYKGDKAGVYDFSQNDWLMPLELDGLSNDNGFLFVNGVALYSKGDKEGVILETGETTGALYDEVHCFDYYVKARIGDKWGYINHGGELTDDEDEAYYTESEY